VTDPAGSRRSAPKRASPRHDRKRFRGTASSPNPSGAPNNTHTIHADPMEISERWIEVERVPG